MFVRVIVKKYVLVTDEAFFKTHSHHSYYLYQGYTVVKYDVFVETECKVNLIFSFISHLGDHHFLSLAI